MNVPSVAPSGGGPGGAETGWEEVGTEINQTTGIIIDIIGQEGTGRSSLALTMPGPVAYINSDEKIEGIVQPHVVKGKAVKVWTYGFIASSDKQDNINRAAPIWWKMQAMCKESIEWASTTIIDTQTDAWELARLGEFGEVNPKVKNLGSAYGDVNMQFRGNMKQFRIAAKSNLVTIHQVKDEYVNDKRSGRMLRAGFREMGYIANVVVRTGKYFDPVRGLVFTATIEKGWFNALTEGLTVEGEDCRLPLLLSYITGLPEGSW